MLRYTAIRGLDPPLKDPLSDDVNPSVTPLRNSSSAASYAHPPTQYSAASPSSKRSSSTLSPLPPQRLLRERRRRVRSVEVLRGFSVISMIVAHFVDYLSRHTGDGIGLAFAASYGLGTWVAPALLVLSGIGQALSQGAAVSHGKGGAVGHTDWTKCWTRSVQLVGLEMYLKAAEGRLYEDMTWGVLTLYAVTNPVLCACRSLPSATLVLLAATVAGLAPSLRAAVDVSDAWEGFQENLFVSRYIPGLLWEPTEDLQDTPWTWRAIAQSVLLSGAFPVFPWLCFPLIGMALGRRMVAQQFGTDLAVLRFLGVTLAGLGLSGACYGMRQPGSSIVTSYLSPLSFYPNSFTMVLVQLGLVLVALTWAFSRYDSKTADRPVVEEEVSLVEAALRRTSRCALGLYFWHFELIDWALLLLARVLGPEAGEGECLNPWSAVAIGVGAVALLEGCLFVLDRTQIILL